VKSVLRLVAALFAVLTAVLAVLFAANMWFEPRSVGPVRMALLVALVALAGFATVQLWRAKHSGRYAGVGLILMIAVLVAIVRPSGQDVTVSDLCYAGCGLLLVGILLLPMSRRVCS
jgi:hypothetical protein